MVESYGPLDFDALPSSSFATSSNNPPLLDAVSLQQTELLLGFVNYLADESKVRTLSLIEKEAEAYKAQVWASHQQNDTNIQLPYELDEFEGQGFHFSDFRDTLQDSSDTKLSQNLATIIGALRLVNQLQELSHHHLFGAPRYDKPSVLSQGRQLRPRQINNNAGLYNQNLSSSSLQLGEYFTPELDSLDVTKPAGGDWMASQLPCVEGQYPSRYPLTPSPIHSSPPRPVFGLRDWAPVANPSVYPRAYSSNLVDHQAYPSPSMRSVSTAPWCYKAEVDWFNEFLKNWLDENSDSKHSALISFLNKNKIYIEKIAYDLENPARNAIDKEKVSVKALSKYKPIHFYTAAVEVMYEIEKRIRLGTVKANGDKSLTDKCIKTRVDKVCFYFSKCKNSAVRIVKPKFLTDVVDMPDAMLCRFNTNAVGNHKKSDKRKRQNDEGEQEPPKKRKHENLFDDDEKDEDLYQNAYSDVVNSIDDGLFGDRFGTSYL